MTSKRTKHGQKIFLQKFHLLLEAKTGLLKLIGEISTGRRERNITGGNSIKYGPLAPILVPTSIPRNLVKKRKLTTRTINTIKMIKTTRTIKTTNTSKTTKTINLTETRNTIKTTNTTETTKTAMAATLKIQVHPIQRRISRSWRRKPNSTIRRLISQL